MNSGTNPPSGVNESCMAFTAPVDVAVVTVAKSAERATPKRTSFRLRPVGHQNEEGQHAQHRSENRPALPGVANHCSERVGQSSGNHGFSQDQHEIGQRRRVFIGMSGIGIKKSATVCSEVLDGHL